MFGPGTQNVDNETARRRDVTHDGPEQAGGSSLTTGIGVAPLSHVMNSSRIGASHNAPVRAAAMEGMQQAHGNRAVQRSLSTGSPARGVSVQRDVSSSPYMDGFGGEQPFGPMPAPVYGPALAPTDDPAVSQQGEYGGVSVMEDDVLKESVAQMDSIEDSEARAEAVREALSTLSTTHKSDDGDDGYGDYVTPFDSYSEGNTSAMQAGVPQASVSQASVSQASVSQASVPQGEDSNSFNPAGDTNNIVGAGTTAANMAMLHNPLFSGLPGLAEDFNVFSLAKGGSSMLNTGTSALGVGLGAYNTYKAYKEGDLAGGVQSVADTAASGAGFAGPYGMAFSGGYAAGQLLDKGADWIGDKIWGEGDHSLHHGVAEHVLPHILPSPQSIRDSWEVFRGRGTEAQQENAEKRADEVEYEHLRDARKDREQKARDEAEMADLREKMYNPTVGGMMSGTPGDALSGSAIAAQFMSHEVDEDGVPIPHVSMALPEPASKRRR